MNRYNKIKIIGKGTFGSAWLVESKQSGKRYAVKELNVGIMPAEERHLALNEVKILSTLKHKNIVRYKDAFEESGQFFIVMEYAERDLKAQNIFLSKYDVIKIGDFGIARILDSTSDHAQTTVGTPYYLSPEICQRQPCRYNQKSDMWALGCVLYEIVTLKHPFTADNFSSLIVKILHGNIPPIPRFYGPLLEDLVAVLLRTNPEERPSAKQLLHVPAMQTYVERFALVQRDRISSASSSISNEPKEQTSQTTEIKKPEVIDGTSYQRDDKTHSACSGKKTKTVLIPNRGKVHDIPIRKSGKSGENASRVRRIMIVENVSADLCAGVVSDRQGMCKMIDDRSEYKHRKAVSVSGVGKISAENPNIQACGVSRVKGNDNVTRAAAKHTDCHLSIIKEDKQRRQSVPSQTSVAIKTTKEADELSKIPGKGLTKYQAKKETACPEVGSVSRCRRRSCDVLDIYSVKAGLSEDVRSKNYPVPKDDEQTSDTMTGKVTAKKTSRERKSDYGLHLLANEHVRNAEHILPKDTLSDAKVPAKSNINKLDKAEMKQSKSRVKKINSTSNEILAEVIVLNNRSSEDIEKALPCVNENEPFSSAHAPKTPGRTTREVHHGSQERKTRVRAASVPNTRVAHARRKAAREALSHHMHHCRRLTNKSRNSTSACEERGKENVYIGNIKRSRFPTTSESKRNLPLQPRNGEEKDTIVGPMVPFKRFQTYKVSQLRRLPLLSAPDETDSRGVEVITTKRRSKSVAQIPVESKNNITTLKGVHIDKARRRAKKMGLAGEVGSTRKEFTMNPDPVPRPVHTKHLTTPVDRQTETDARAVNPREKPKEGLCGCTKRSSEEAVIQQGAYAKDEAKVKFQFCGETLHLNATDVGSAFAHMEALRVFLEERLGTERFVQAYQCLNDGASTCDGEARMRCRVRSILGQANMDYLPVLNQLIACETSSFSTEV